jgi:hypothetical protein
VPVERSVRTVVAALGQSLDQGKLAAGYPSLYRPEDCGDATSTDVESWPVETGTGYWATCPGDARHPRAEWQYYCGHEGIETGVGDEDPKI